MDSDLEPIRTFTDFIRFQKLVFPATEKQPITGLHALPVFMAEHDFSLSFPKFHSYAGLTVRYQKSLTSLPTLKKKIAVITGNPSASNNLA